MRGAETEYNQVAYPSAIYPQTHPDRLATLGRLFGLAPEKVESARVLELGCGDGANLIAMAAALPNSRFMGIDLASDPVRRGGEVIKALDISNVDLQVGDIMQADFGDVRFDYIIAHGLYSWVPAPVRDRVLQICRDHLGENGIAYISYNAYPGNHLRDLARGMMQYHARHFPDPLQQIRQTRGLLKLVSEARTPPDVFQQVVKQELERCLKYTDAGFYHDDLSAMNQPVYFWQFAGHAKAFGLQFLAEADFSDMQTEGLAPQVLEVLKGLDPRNFIAREQYLDFFKGRAFRQTLICRGNLKVDREVQPGRLADLLVSADARSVAINGDDEDFAGPHGAVISTADAAARAALNYLGAIWPKRISIRELASRCSSASHAKQMTDSRAHAIPSPGGEGKGEGESNSMCAFFLRCYEIGFVNLHTSSPHFITEISERPIAAPLARYHATLSDVVPTPLHTTLKLDGPIARKLVRLLDGTNHRAAFLRKLSADEHSFDAEALDALLRHLARAGILIA